jgi:hypothetical protein|tara:strand:+ start:2561 stop:2836 length:276 start_codon:yes stop_codon:yes gene_type:complete
MRPADKLKSHDVDHPDHYTQNDIECIEYIEQQLGDEFQSYLEGCIIKYIHRYKHKENPKKDLQKAKWYLNKLIETTSYSFNLETIEDADGV